MEEAILATDLDSYFKRRDRFFKLVNTATYDWTRKDHRSLLRSMLMTCCDIAAITKPWLVALNSRFDTLPHRFALITGIHKKLLLNWLLASFSSKVTLKESNLKLSQS